MRPTRGVAAANQPVSPPAPASWPGQPFPLGASWDGEGANFAVWSSSATAVWVCLFDEDGRETRVPLTQSTFQVWHGYPPGGDKPDELVDGAGRVAFEWDDDRQEKSPVLREFASVSGLNIESAAWHGKGR